jgi:putative molybdopterin biosynthesis protein
MEKRNLYLKNTPLDDAQKLFMDRLVELCEVKYEVVDVVHSLERITKEAVYAKRNAPSYNAAAMDGIAVKSADTAGASEKSPVVITKENYQVVNTGNVIRDPYDAVIMAEDIVELPDDSVRIITAATPWQHIRPIGEDVVVGEMILPGAHKIRSIDIGMLLEAGIFQIEVVKKPTVAVFPTGSEIVEPKDDVKDGEIIESNSRMLENLIYENGGNATRFPIIPDEYEQIKKAVSDAAKQFDMVIINAGTSAGTKDFTVSVLRELGEVLLHGVAVKPGKPVILAFVEGKPVIGIPGYPVSAYIAFENFAVPALQYLGMQSGKLEKIEAVLSKRVVSSLKYQEYVRVKVGKVDGKFIAVPLARGAGVAMSMVRADGFCVIPQNSEGVEAGETVEVTLYSPKEELENTAVIIGSHDMILDVLADMMATTYKGMFLSSTHVGSMGGLMSLKRGEALMAPTHLLDENTGVYNVSYLNKMFREPMALIKGVDRIQGIIVEKGNPLGIQTLKDLPGKRYVNRQRGAGTRVLLDYRLKELGIQPEEIQGYDWEVTTHMAVAVAVKSKNADAGMGVMSAARAMDLDFVEVGVEEYDFAIAQRHLELPIVKAFIELLKSEQFHNKLDELGGYGYDRSGEILLLTDEKNCG